MKLSRVLNLSVLYRGSGRLTRNSLGGLAEFGAETADQLRGEVRDAHTLGDEKFATQNGACLIVI
jgi:hypothetical protein